MGSSSSLLTDEEFASKVEWEGGVFGALEYGLRPEEMRPGALRDAYKELWDVYHGRMYDLMQKVEELLP